MEPLEKWLFGGQNRQFFRDHEEQAQQFNSNMIGLLNIIMTLVTAVYFIFDLNSVGKAMRMSYLWFFLCFFTIYVYHHLYAKKKLRENTFYFCFLAELIFVFLLLVGPVYDSGNLACFIPVYLVILPLLGIWPLYVGGGLAVADFFVFSAVTLLCKARETAVFDIVDGLTCVIIGLTLGRSILGSRLREMDTYDRLKRQSDKALAHAMDMANKDPLTGVKSRAAYENMERELDSQITGGCAAPFGIVMVDLNWLKETNDTQGHEFGDRLIQECSRVVCTIFSHSPVFRYGGDEFVVLLRGQDYENRAALMARLRSVSVLNGWEKPFAYGMSEYRPEVDWTVNEPFTRADAAMYENKKVLKGQE